MASVPDTTICYSLRRGGLKAYGHYSGKPSQGRGPSSWRFIVKAGSTVSSNQSENDPMMNHYRRRIELLKKQYIRIPPEGGAWELVKDYEFNSPSEAASVVLGQSASQAEWRDAQGKTPSKNKGGHLEESDSLPHEMPSHHEKTYGEGDFSRCPEVEERLLNEYRIRLEGISSTEKKQMIGIRVGQDVLREYLLAIQEKCPLTGITDQALLRVSHIKRWSECEDHEKLDPDNCLLLSALWDAAFDQGLVTFNDAGQPEFSPRLSHAAQAELRRSEKPIPLTDRNKDYLTWHRKEVFKRMC